MIAWKDELPDGRFWLIDPKTGKKRKRLKTHPRTKSWIPDEKADESWVQLLKKSKGGAVKSRRKPMNGIAKTGLTRANHR